MELCEIDNRDPLVNELPPRTRRIRHLLSSLGHD